jgi:regulator of replication initiation timing
MAGEILAPDEINALDNLTSPVISDAAQKKIWALKSQLAKYEEIIASMPELLEYNERLRVENEYLRQGG